MTRSTTPRIMSLGLGLILVLTTLVVGTGPAAAVQHTATETSAAEFVVDGNVLHHADPITIDDLRELLARLADEGEVAREARVRVYLDIAELYYDWLGCRADRFVHAMEGFKRQASDPFNVPSESAQAELVAAADELIEQLCGSDS